MPTSLAMFSPRDHARRQWALGCSSWLDLVMLGAVCGSACGVSSSRSASQAWTVLRLGEARVSVPAGWSAEILEQGFPYSPTALWLSPLPNAPPIIVSSGPAASSDGTDRTRDDVVYMMKDLDGAASLTFAAVQMKYVACGLTRGKWLDIMCVWEPPGCASGAMVIWMAITDEQLAAIGGVSVLAEIASRAVGLQYRERRYE